MDRIGLSFKTLPHIDSSTKIIDSMIQRSDIGANVRKCPTCEREVNSNEKFYMDSGAKL